MTDSDPPKRVAKTLYNNDEYERAGEQFTSAAYTTLGSSVIGESVRSLAGGLEYLLYASLAFRRARVYDRCANRARQGMLVAADARDACYDDPADKGVLTEFVGDFETIGDVESPADSYRTAAQYYANADTEYTTSRNADPLDSRLHEFFKRVLRDAEYELPDWFQPRYAYTVRVNFKSKELGAIVETLEE